jgi:cell division protein FtsW (lipid II flippase)
MLLIIGLVVIVWWPLVEDYSHYINPDYPIWIQIDWLLIGIFFVMSILVTIGADIRRDAMLVLVSFIGGFVIESWGTHTGLWAYYTGENLRYGSCLPGLSRPWP